MSLIPPKYLVLSGGGVKVVAMVGAIKGLHEAGYMKHVKEASGVSAGAWLAFMIAAGLHISVIEKLILEFEFSHIRNLNPEALLSFPETFGLDDGQNLVKFLESIFRIAIKINPSITFSEFDKLQLSEIEFRCWATDLKEQATCEFSLKETPNVKIIDALRASMSLPLYFTALEHPVTKNLLSDGGIQGNLPLYLLTDDQLNNCIGIAFSYSSKKSNPSDLMQFMSSIFACLIHSRHEEISEKWKHKVIKIPIRNIESWEFEISREQRRDLIEVGLKTAREWLSRGWFGSRKILRRHSFQ